MIPFILLSVALGLKHSYDPDHLIAVGSFLRKSKSHTHSLKIGLWWALGHMLTATVVTLLLYFFKESMLQQILPYFERVVAVMIILLGIWSLIDIIHWHTHRHGTVEHAHPHTHLKKSHDHKHMFGIGILHGLASNDELLLLMTATLGVSSLAGLLTGLGFFSIGVVAGMMLFAIICSYPLVKSRNIKNRSDLFYRGITFITGVAGIGYGAMMLV